MRIRPFLFNHQKLDTTQKKEYDKTMGRLAIIEHLTATGVNERQARAHADAITKAVDKRAATKADLAELKFDLLKWIVGVAIALAALQIAIAAVTLSQ